MQKYLLVILALFHLTTALAQQSEIALNLNSGLFSFAGSATAAVSGIGSNGSTYNPYGSQYGYCDGLALNFKRISKSGFILGLEIGLEALRSKVSIDRVGVYSGTSYLPVAADGRTYLKTSFLNFAPYVGYRYPIKGVTMDFSTGLDIAHCISMKEEGKATDINGNEYRVNRNYQDRNSDIRLRTQLSIYYRWFGIFSGYCYGVTNYYKQFSGNPMDCTSRLVRFGMSVRLNDALRQITAPLQTSR